MDAQFWHERWEAGEIGFHQDEVHGALRRHWQDLELIGNERVLVPLSGKSRDLLWLLERGHRVVGVEISSRAVADFFRENNLTARQEKLGYFERWTCDELEILLGDFLELESDQLGTIDAVYDRASLVALPPMMRNAYSHRFHTFAPKGLKALLITLEYEQSKMGGPPFSVGFEEVKRLYGDAFAIELLEDMDIIEQEPRFRQKGLGWLKEKTIRMQRR